MKRSENAPSRTPRLIKVWHLLTQNPYPGGLTPKQLANRCSVCTRTAYRDLEALQTELGVPIGEEGTRRYILPGYQLPPIRFSIPEALTIFLAARLMVSLSRRYDPNIASTFFKLNSAIAAPLQDQVKKSIDWLERQPLNAAVVRNLATLADAWVNQRTVSMWYQALGDAEATERRVDPYFIEPAAAGHASYLIAYCHRAGEIRMFKIERIKSLELTPDEYVVPSDFDATAYLSSAWGIVAGDEVETVKLRFEKDLAPIMEETRWHPSQSVERQGDGSAVVTFVVTSTFELCAWVMGWGEKVEVLEPESLREEVIATAEAILDLYGQDL